METEIESTNSEKTSKAFSVAVLRVVSCAMIIASVTYLKFYNAPVYERFCSVYKCNESDEMVSADEFTNVIKRFIANLKN